jgi:hypothetical protein
MAQPVSTPHDIPATVRPDRLGTPVIWVSGGVLGGAVLLGTLALWVHYGTAVFFAMITSGLAACL